MLFPLNSGRFQFSSGNETKPKAMAGTGRKAGGRFRFTTSSPSNCTMIKFMRMGYFLTVSFLPFLCFLYNSNIFTVAMWIEEEERKKLLTWSWIESREKGKIYTISSVLWSGTWHTMAKYYIKFLFFCLLFHDEIYYKDLKFLFALTGESPVVKSKINNWLSSGINFFAPTPRCIYKKKH